MSQDTHIYDYVMARLREKVVPQRQVAHESGVPFSTVTKIAQGAVTNPSVHTIQALFDYFRSKGENTADQPKSSACSAVSH